MIRNSLFRAAILALFGLSSYEAVRLAHRGPQPDPENPDFHMQLGQRAELSGDLPLAERSLLHAAAISRLYQPRYLLAQFYFRHPAGDRFSTWLRASLDTAYGDVGPLFDLAWRDHPDGEWLWQHSVPRRNAIAGQYLGLLTAKREWGTAAEVARYLADNAVPSDLPALLAWCDTRLAAGDVRDPRAVWDELCRRKLLPYDPSALITNAAFSQHPLSAGFDWHPAVNPGVNTTVGGGRLRIDFTGKQPEQCTLIWQYVAVEPGAMYMLDERGLPDGLFWNLEGADEGYTEIRDTWFRSKKPLVELGLIYRRPSGATRLAESVTVDAPRLEKSR